MEIVYSSSRSSEVLIKFSDNLVGPLCPSNFLVTAQRFYPHSPPRFQCLESGFEIRYIDPDGFVNSDTVFQSWNALCNFISHSFP